MCVYIYMCVCVCICLYFIHFQDYTKLFYYMYICIFFNLLCLHDNSAEMSNSQQDVKKRDGYDHWTKEESRALLDIMVDATSRGWRNNGGIFSKKIVKDRILPLLNSKLECNKNYKNYQSRLKWFRKRWSSYSTLLEFNSGFGYDATTKRFTAENELWDNYLKVLCFFSKFLIDHHMFVYRKIII